MRSHDGCDGTQFFSISSFTAQKKKKRGQAVEPKDYQRVTLPPLLKKTREEKNPRPFLSSFLVEKEGTAFNTVARWEWDCHRVLDITMDS